HGTSPSELVETRGGCAPQSGNAGVEARVLTRKSKEPLRLKTAASTTKSVLSVSHPWLMLSSLMRYLVKARVKTGKNSALLRAIENGTLGKGSIAGDEYLCDMEQARVN